MPFGPKNDMQIIEEMKFVLLGTRMLMVVIITDSGLVKETIIKYDEDITESQVETLNNLFNTKLKGKPLSKASSSSFINPYMTSCCEYIFYSVYSYDS